MPNNFLAPHATPKNRKEAVSDALNLLASFGGGSDELRKMLAETRDAITHNEKLISDAQAVIQQAKDIWRREEEVTTREAEVNARWAILEEIKEGIAAMDRR